MPSAVFFHKRPERGRPHSKQPFSRLSSENCCLRNTPKSFALMLLDEALTLFRGLAHCQEQRKQDHALVSAFLCAASGAESFKLVSNQKHLPKQSILVVRLLPRMLIIEDYAGCQNQSGNCCQHKEDHRQTRITENLKGCFDAHH